jgi:hypothetical protein
MAAIVELLEANSQAQRGAVLAAVDSDILSVSIAARRPAIHPSFCVFPPLSGTRNGYAGSLSGREIIPTVDSADVPRWRDLPWRDYWRCAIRPLRISVSLTDRSFATFETR